MPLLMKAASVVRIEKTVDRTASALFALACGYAANFWFAGELAWPVAGAATAAAAAFAYLLSVRMLDFVQPLAPRLPVPIFDVRDVEPMESAGLMTPQETENRDPAELLLTDRFEPSPEDEPLLLDDVLEEPGSNSRVVRLFDPSTMPTAAGRKPRIDGHFENAVTEAQTQDAARALHEALAELRRSLR
ncbi:MAG TPA: hypothetical protein VHS33_08955 [Sphingomicrobium sp.]|jgi:hypothetical protein|nr:hypothetical protein [Sphingomicrobium sp.]